MGRVGRLCEVCMQCTEYRCVAVCCSVLQCVAVCCSVLQCDAISVGHKGDVLRGAYMHHETCGMAVCAVCCCVLLCVAVCCDVCGM